MEEKEIFTCGKTIKAGSRVCPVESSGKNLMHTTCREFFTLHAQKLQIAEDWFWRQANNPSSPAFLHSRGRMWCIFMLLRYGALRLKEIFTLEANDLNFREGYLESVGRMVPFSESVSCKLAAFWSQWPGKDATRHPLECDSSQVRRNLATCARACHIPCPQLNSSSLRQYRMLELQNGGLHPVLLSLFLGKSQNTFPFSREEATQLIRNLILKENKMKTSARNVFYGKIVAIEKNGILVKVILETAQGLRITSIITQTSNENLNLATGMMVTALIKAPWVTVIGEDERPMTNGDNCFQGTVESIQEDTLACEIAVALPQGNQVCALYANGARPSSQIRQGASVFICFSAFAVILTTN